MSKLDAITPRSRPLVIDLVREAGIDISDWANGRGGAARASTNPKYCYNWSFVQPGVAVVLNLWLEGIEERQGKIIRKFNMRRLADEPDAKPMWKKRAFEMDQAIQTAFHEQLPVRVIVCDGKQRRGFTHDALASIVTKRMLDPEAWAVTSYSPKSGNCILTRGANPRSVVDQFTDLPGYGPAQRRAVAGDVFVRSADVRNKVLRRSGGMCEFCGRRGFSTKTGQIFLETHHVVPLSENGPDTVENVVALCPNHHREVHLGKCSDAIRRKLVEARPIRPRQ